MFSLIIYPNLKVLDQIFFEVSSVKENFCSIMSSSKQIYPLYSYRDSDIVTLDLYDLDKLYLYHSYLSTQHYKKLHLKFQLYSFKTLQTLLSVIFFFKLSIIN